MGARGVFFVLVESAWLQFEGVGKRTEVEMALGVEEMKPHGGHVGIIAVLLDGIVGREETGAGDDPVEREKDEEPFCDGGVKFHVGRLAVGMRGSAQNKRRSVRRLPTTRNRVESRTPPMTT